MRPFSHHVRVDDSEWPFDRFRPDRRSLFPGGRARTSDVVTRHYADDYLLATVKAILDVPNGEPFVHSMFQETGDRVIVRFYGKVKYWYGTDVFDVDIERTTPVHGSGVVGSVQRVFQALTGAQPALWVLLLEKAYAAFWCSQTNQRYQMAAMRGFAGGAMGSLLGTGDSTQVYVPEPAPLEGHKLLRRLLEIPRSERDRRPIPRSRGAERQYRLDFPDVNVRNAHAAWLNRDVANAWLRHAQHFDKREYGHRGELFHTMRLGDLTRFLAAHECPPEVEKRIVYLVEYEELFAGKRGTGVYSGQQLRIFSSLERWLSEGKPLVAQTRSFIGHSEKAKTANKAASLMTWAPDYYEDYLPPEEREVEVAGLRRSSSYTILGLSLEEAGTRLRFVVLANPDERTGRAYEWDAATGHMKPRAAKLPGPAFAWTKSEAHPRHEMHVELSDFVKRFSCIFVAPPLTNGR